MKIKTQLTECLHFSQQAREGNFQFLTERPESSSMAAILKKAQKPNVLLVGPSRSGKTSLVHLLARQHPEWKIYGFSLAGILSGTPYRGMAEERMEQIIAAATETGSILFFDEAHQLLTHSELVNQLKPYLSDNPNFRCIAATTTEEHRRFENDRAIMERFTVLKINPMIKDDQSNAFVKKANEMSLKHKISLSHVLVLQAEKMACLLFKDTCLDNFIDLIDIACVLATDQNCEEVALSHLITAASIHSGWDPNDIINLL